MFRSLLSHSLVYTGARLAAGLIGVIATAALTRLLEPEQYGIYALILVIMGLGSTVAFDWLGISFLRFYQARREDPRLMATFNAMFMALAPGTGLLFAVAWLAGLVAPRDPQIVIVGLLLVWAASWFEFVSKIALAEFRSLNYLLMSFARSGFTLVGACGGAWLTGSPIWAGLGVAAGSFAAARLVGIRLPSPSTL